MRYKIVAGILMAFWGKPVYAQEQPIPDSLKLFLDKSLNIIQANAINKEAVNWQALKTTVYQKAKGAATYQDLLPIYPYIFEQIGDHHGALRFKGKSYYWKNSSAYHNQTVSNAVKTHSEVTVKLINKNVGYILLPGNNDFGGKNIDKDGQAIRDAISAVNNKHIKSWIIDLRVNTGGNMYQMLAGIGQLLGDGKVGGFVNQHQQPDGDWIIKEGNIYIDTNKVSNLKNEGFVSKTHLPVAVLISGRTASSGEVVAISFAGRKNAVLIGENSAGYTTANQGFELNKDAGLNLAIDYDADRNGKVYRHLVLPDIFIEGGDNFEDPAKDSKVMKALEWLAKHK